MSALLRVAAVAARGVYLLEKEMDETGGEGDGYRQHLEEVAIEWEGAQDVYHELVSHILLSWVSSPLARNGRRAQCDVRIRQLTLYLGSLHD